MIIKKTWKTILENNKINIPALIDNDIISLATDIDSNFLEKYGHTTEVKNLLNVIKEDYLNPLTTIWTDMPIYLSSYKENDRRIVKDLRDRLVRYISFYNKMLVDDGIAKTISIKRKFMNDSKQEDLDKNAYSETPSIELNNFEEGIKYASNLSQNTSDSLIKAKGRSLEDSETKSWDETLKNLRFTFYNDLMDWIGRIPNVIYEYYALDSRPAIELLKSTLLYMKTIIKL